MANLRVAEFSAKGWVKLSYCLTAADLSELESFKPFEGRGRRLTDMEDVRSCLPNEMVAELSKFGFDSTPLRAVGFHKSKLSNWSLPWHQDRVVAMRERIDDPALTNWSRKNGVWHCEASENTLRQISFLYIAFDHIHENSGGIELAEGTHLQGKIRSQNIELALDKTNTVSPIMFPGECLLVSALTLHRSGLNNSINSRRSLRIDVSRDGGGACGIV